MYLDSKELVDKKTKEIGVFRKNMRMEPIISGFRYCLMCEKKFFSDDVKRIRVCMRHSKED